MTTSVLTLPPTELIQTLRPMLAKSAEVPLAALSGTFAFEEKLDGIRALAAVGPGGFALRNRNAVDITHRYPDLTSLTEIPTTMLLDGEIVCMAPELGFETIAKRDRQHSGGNILRMANLWPAMLVAFDVLVIDSMDVRGLPYVERRALLEQHIPTTVATVQVATRSTDPALFDALAIAGREGVVAKRLDSSYMSGRSGAWIKYKVKFSVSAIAVGYERGNGKRAECGKFLLAILDEKGVPVEIGKVGSGFTESELAEVKGQIDQQKLPVLEIECMGLTSGGLLRQPVFKGIRTDVNVLDVRTDQLESLPKETIA